MYKYSYYVDWAHIPTDGPGVFPQPQLCLYAICMTLYVIPFYRYIAPWLLNKRRYGWFVVALIVYFGFVSKLSSLIVAASFRELVSEPAFHQFYAWQFALYKQQAVLGWNIDILFTDIIAFLSITFLRAAFEQERKKHLLEKDNLVLQLESLKAQLHPHFLFNTLNNIYGMSLTGNKETPAFILRLSDMMRYILYDCQQHTVPLEKDIAFLENYLEMEKKRYPLADIQFTVEGNAANLRMAPLLFIQFVENSFKHGAHRFNDTGFIHGGLTVENSRLIFRISNDVFLVPTQFAGEGNKNNLYGGVGIENVRKRLQLYYPGKHTLSLNKNASIFEVTLTIDL
jgi:LytS/YehU family sensor histidine kinase